MFVIMPATALMVVVVVVSVAAAFVLFIVLVVMAMVMLVFFHFVKFARKGIDMLHSRKNCLAVQLVPVRSYDGRMVVMCLDKLQRGCKLVFARNVDVAENYAGRSFNLVVEKLAEVLHIHFAF